jgi:hypothetical protein
MQVSPLGPGKKTVNGYNPPLTVIFFTQKSKMGIIWGLLRFYNFDIKRIYHFPCH